MNNETVDCPKRPDRQNGQKTSRRSFLNLCLGGGLAAWGAAMIGPTIFYVWPARGRGGNVSSISAGTVKEFPTGSGKVVMANGKPILVIRTGDETFKAFSAICTHLGCVVKWSSEKARILCPCHAAVFGTDGKVISGPPPAPLPEYAVSVSGGEIIVKL